MKKVLYIVLLTLSCALTVVSCTEEDVKPKSENGGGGGSQGKL